MIKLIPVKSSNIKAVAYDPTTEILTVEFKSGGIYEYSKVSKKVYTAFVASDSLGRFFFKKIRNVYKTKKV